MAVMKNKLPNYSSPLTAIATYIKDISTITSTAHEYFSRLNDFKNFIAKYNNQSIDDLLKIKWATTMHIIYLIVKRRI